jgi:hypothetical protein
MSVNFYQTTRYYIPDVTTLYSHCCEAFRFNAFSSMFQMWCTERRKKQDTLEIRKQSLIISFNYLRYMTSLTDAFTISPIHILLYNCASTLIHVKCVLIFAPNCIWRQFMQLQLAYVCVCCRCHASNAGWLTRRLYLPPMWDRQTDCLLLTAGLFVSRVPGPTTCFQRNQLHSCTEFTEFFWTFSIVLYSKKRNVVFFWIQDDGKSPENFCEFCTTYTIVRTLSSLPITFLLLLNESFEAWNSYK